MRRWNWITLRAASCRGAVIVLKGAYSMHEALCKYSRPVSGCAVFCMFIRGGDGLRMREFNIHMHILSTGKTWFEVDRQLTVSVPPCTHLDITHIQKLTSIFPLCLSMSFSDLFFFFDIVFAFWIIQDWWLVSLFNLKVSLLIFGAISSCHWLQLVGNLAFFQVPT